MNLQLNPAARASQPAQVSNDVENDIPNDADGVTASHAVPAEAVVFALGSDPARGLSRAEAQRRLQDPRESALPYEAIVITAIVVLNALLGFFQEARAERSVRALMALAAPESTVVREGERQRIAAHEIVPGDIILVEAGDKIPADARIIEDANLRTDEAPLTGESMPVAKSPKPVPADVGLGDRVNMLFAGTVATYGR